MSGKFDFTVGSEAIRALPGKLLENFVEFVATATIARFLGASGLGTYSLLYTAVKTSTIFTRGVGEALKKRMSEEGANPGEHVGAGLLFLLVFVVLTAVPTVAVIQTAPEFLPVTQKSGYALLFAYHAYGLLNLSRHVYAAVGEPAQSIWIEPLARSLVLAAQLGFLWQGHGIAGLIVGILLGMTSTSIIGLYLTGTWPTIPSRRTIRNIVTFAKWSIPGELLGAAYNYSDTIALYVLVGASALGYFSAAANIVLVGTVVGPSLAQPLTVKTSHNHSKNDDTDSALTTSLAFAGSLSLPILGLAIAIPEMMAEIFGSEFTGTGYVLILIACYSVFSVYRRQFAAALNGIDRPRLPTLSRLGQLVIYVPIMVGLTQIYGLLGALAGSLGVEFLGCFALWFFARKHFDRLFDWRTIGAQGVGSVALVAAARPTYLLVGGLSGVAFAVLVAVGVYFATTYTLSPRLRSAYIAYCEVVLSRVGR